MSFLGAAYAREVSVPVDWRRRGVAETQSAVLVESLGEAQRWDFTIGLQTDVWGKLELAAKLSVHRRRNQHNGVFDLLVPQPLGQIEPPSGLAVVVPVKTDAGATQVVVQRTSANAWTVPISRYITFAGHSKVYSVEEAKSLRNINTNYALDIYPALREDVAAAAVVDFTPNARVKWHPDDIDNELMYTNGSIFTYKAMFAEAL